MRLFKLDIDNKIKENLNIINFLNPDYIYIPYEKDIDLTKVSKNESINSFKSSISGTIVGLKMGVFNNKYNNAYIIANNFKELEIKKNKRIKISIENIKKILLENKETELLNKFNKESIDNIVISAISFKRKC